MSEDFLKKCIELSGKNTEFFDLPTVSDWRRLEEELGLAFPDSQKQFLNAFGSGYFGDFQLWNPAGKGRFELSKARLLDTIDGCEALKHMDLRAFKQAGGVVFAGRGAAAKLYALKPNGLFLQRELIEVNLSAREVIETGMGIAEFIYTDYTVGYHDEPRRNDQYLSKFFTPYPC